MEWKCICCGKDEIIKWVITKTKNYQCKGSYRNYKKVEELVRKGESVTDKERKIMRLQESY
jgi:hypothetical protein